MIGDVMYPEAKVAAGFYYMLVMLAFFVGMIFSPNVGLIAAGIVAIAPLYLALLVGSIGLMIFGIRGRNVVVALYGSMLLALTVSISWVAILTFPRV